MKDSVTQARAATVEMRLVGRLSINFLLDLVNIERKGGSLLTPLIVTAIVEANVVAISRDLALQRAYASLDAPPPDELRRPVSVNGLAQSLSLPFETVRRHVAELVRAGVCVATPAGVYVPTTVLCSEAYFEAARRRYDRFLALEDELADIGVLPRRTAPALEAGDPRAPVRAIGRLISEYFLRTIDVSLQQFGEPLRGLLLLEITRANTEHLPLRRPDDLDVRSPFPDSLRRPVRISSLAKRLGVPDETVRRHAAALCAQGYCQRSAKGLLVSGKTLAHPVMVQAMRDNLANVRRMYRHAEQLRPAQAPSGG